MYIQDGIVYGEEPIDMIKVSDIKILPDRIMLLTFSNGERRLFDADILKGGVFERLRDEKLFDDVSIEYGVVTWDKGKIDCAPEFMYENSYEYNDGFDISVIEFVPNVAMEKENLETMTDKKKKRAPAFIINRGKSQEK